MKKAVVFLCFSFVLILSGCVFNANIDTYDENVDMTPRLIEISEQTPITEVIASVKGAVVGVMTVTGDGYSIGSGVSVSGGGYILTNHHVIDNAKSITIYLADQTTAGAQLLYSDSAMDIAVLKCEKNLPYLVCTTKELSVGEDVIAIGTPLSLDFKNTVTKGIVSALNRTVGISSLGGYTTYMQNLIQHDASINPGNSGGPIINLKGEVVGINTLKASEAEGIGFAIPISVGKTAIEKLSVSQDWKPSYIGIFALDNEVAKFKGEQVSTNQGVFVASVDEESLCKDCFIKGDIILEINGEKINSVLDLRLALYKYKSGDILVVKVLRNDEIIETRCNISQR